MWVKWKRYFRLRRWLRSISFLLSDPITRLSAQGSVPEAKQVEGQSTAQANSGEKHLLLIKTEAIGDYILFRNFLQVLRESETYKDFKISLIGNEIWKPLFLSLDATYVNHAYFMNRSRFMSEPKYRHEFLQQFSKTRFLQVINCTYSREFITGDLLVRSLAAKHKIGMMGDSVSEIPPLKFLGNTFYSRLVGSDRNNYFEFARNKHFFEQILEKPIDLSRPEIALDIKKMDYVVLLPGAQDKVREWPAENFKNIAKRIHERYGSEIFLAGSKAEMQTANGMIDEENAGYTKNLCGQTSLQDLPQLLAAARLAVCNDSGTLHIAAAVNVPSVCVSNGNHYGRFTPYPDAEKRDLAFVYPESFLALHVNEDDRRAEMAYGSRYAIGEIDVEMVWKAIEKVMHE
jgi:ADP-heptose:LPS heptosyltransferase